MDCNIRKIILVQGFCLLESDVALFPIGFLSYENSLVRHLLRLSSKKAKQMSSNENLRFNTCLAESNI